MNLLSWNYRGLGKSRAVREVSWILKTDDPQILFLMEMKKKSIDMKRLRVTWRFDCYFSVDCI